MKLALFTRKRVILMLIALAGLYFILVTVPFGKHQMRPMAADQSQNAIPLDPQSPWPKFRANASQTGRSQIKPAAQRGKPWRFRTGKGIFSSPVIDGAGTIYIGSADQFFYALRADGSVKWKIQTGEIIDSSALLDNKGRVYFGSGDAHLYALDRETGQVIWKTRAHTTKEVEERFGVKTYNLDWFEGNVGMLKDGSLIAPNDNYLLYKIDRDSGKILTQYAANELLWSLPAVNPDTGRLFFGSNFVLLKNLFALDESGEEVWTSGGLGSNAASPMLTSADRKGAVVVGGFDGYVRAYAQDSGKQLWKFGTRDHIYASPAQLSNGTIIQPSADGTIYAIDPDTGSQVWAFDTMEPIRSSPAVDGNDVTYVGSGEGKLFAINPDGKLRWAYQCIDENRNDLNSSPALGPDGIVLGGESGEVFFVPYDYPLGDEGRNDPMSIQGPAELLPSDGIHLIYTTPFGGLRLNPPEVIEGNQPLAFTLFVRKAEDTVLAHLDPTIAAVLPEGQRARVNVSADGRFVVMIPEETWKTNQAGEFKFTLKGRVLTDRSRFGLKFYGGDNETPFEKEFVFKARSAAGTALRFPERDGEAGSVFEISRLSVPNPTMLPSWNQIGFDSLHYLAAAVEGNQTRGVFWTIPGKLDPATGRTVVNPALSDRFALNAAQGSGLLTLYNYEPFKLSFVGSWDMPFGLYRIAARLNDSGPFPDAALSAIAHGDEIEFYGKFLKILGLTDFRTGHMNILGGLNLARWGGQKTVPDWNGRPVLQITRTEAVLEIPDSPFKSADHAFGLLLVDAATGLAVPADYARGTILESSASGTLARIRLPAPEAGFPVLMRAYFMVDTTAVSRLTAKRE